MKGLVVLLLLALDPLIRMSQLQGDIDWSCPEGDTGCKSGRPIGLRSVRSVRGVRTIKSVTQHVGRFYTLYTYTYVHLINVDNNIPPRLVNQLTPASPSGQYFVV